MAEVWLARCLTSSVAPFTGNESCVIKINGEYIANTCKYLLTVILHDTTLTWCYMILHDDHDDFIWLNWLLPSLEDLQYLHPHCIKQESLLSQFRNKKAMEGSDFAAGSLSQIRFMWLMWLMWLMYKHSIFIHLGYGSRMPMVMVYTLHRSSSYISYLDIFGHFKWDLSW